MPTQIATETDLLVRARLGDNQAFAALYERHRPAARAAAASLGVPRCDRDDVVEDAFMNVLAALRKGLGPREAFRPYLLMAVRNTTHSRGRSAQRNAARHQRLMSEALCAQVEPSDAGATTDLAVEAFRALPERWQYILLAVDVDGQRASDLAPQLGMSVNAAQALLCRARRGLRNAFLEACQRDHDPKRPAPVTVAA